MCVFMREKNEYAMKIKNMDKILAGYKHVVIPGAIKGTVPGPPGYLYGDKFVVVDGRAVDLTELMSLISVECLNGTVVKERVAALMLTENNMENRILIGIDRMVCYVKRGHIKIFTADPKPVLLYEYLGTNRRSHAIASRDYIIEHYCVDKPGGYVDQHTDIINLKTCKSYPSRGDVEKHRSDGHHLMCDELDLFVTTLDGVDHIYRNGELVHFAKDVKLTYAADRQILTVSDANYLFHGKEDPLVESEDRRPNVGIDATMHSPTRKLTKKKTKKPATPSSSESEDDSEDYTDTPICGPIHAAMSSAELLITFRAELFDYSFDRYVAIAGSFSHDLIKNTRAIVQDHTGSPRRIHGQI
jgi:hypothetical protein